MAKSHEAAAREQRLAAKLRENLRRRKAQARSRDADASAAPDLGAEPNAGSGAPGEGVSPPGEKAD